MLPGRQAVSGFDPRMIPGLTIWLDAADSRTITLDGGRVIGWNDKTSNAYGFSNTSGTGRRGPFYTQTLNGRNVVTFVATSATDPSGTFLANFVSSIPISLSTHALFMVHRPDLTNGTNYGDNNLFVTTSGANQLRFPATISGIAQYSNSAFSNYPLNDVSTAYNISVANLTRESLSVLRNGVRQTNSILGGTATDVSFISTSNVLGALATSGGAQSNFYSGSVAEILFYSNGISASDRREVEGYLAWKWGLQSNLPTTRAFSSNSPLSRPFLPLDIPDCIVWFDAADTRTLTLTGTQVTAWRSKGTIPLTATTTVGSGIASTGYAFTTSSLNTIQFPATSYLIVSNMVTTTQARTLFYIFTVTSFGDGYSGLFATSNTTSGQSVFNAWNRDGNSLIMFVRGSSPSQEVVINGQAPYSGTLPYTGVPFVVGLRHTANIASNAGALLNSGSVNGSNVPLAGNRRISSGYFVGRDTFTLGTFPYSNVQRIGEVIQYDRALTNSEMRMVEGYLCWKWNVSNVEASHPYVRIPPAIPTSIDLGLLADCILWLDAADTTTLTTTGSTVTSWRDKSGLGNTVTFSTGPTTGTAVCNGNNALVFSGTLGSNLTVTVNTAVHTLFAVHAPTSDALNNSLFRFQNGSAGTPYVIFPYYSTSNIGYVTSANGTALRVTGTGLPDSTPPLTYTMITAAVATTSLEVIRNGVTVSSSTAVLSSSDTSGLIVGGISTGSSLYDGNVCELIVFNTKLAYAQRTYVEGYLAKKWALSLPSTHPYLLDTAGPQDGGDIVRRGLVRWLNPNLYTGNLVFPAQVGNPITLISALPHLTTTPGGRAVLDFSINTVGIDSSGLNGSAAATMDLWFRLKGFTTTVPLYGEYNNTMVDNLYFRTGMGLIFNATTGNTLRVYGNNSTGTFDTSFQGGIATNVWHHVSLVIPGTGTQTFVLYWNGVSNASRSISTTRPGTSYFNFNTDGTIANRMNGYIGDFKVYNVALTSNQVKQNYNALAPYYGRDPIA